MGWLEAMRGAVMYQGNTLKLTALADGVVELTFDLQGESVNKFNARAVTELHEALDLLEQHQELSGVLITSAKPAFMVGADRKSTRLNSSHVAISYAALLLKKI